MVIVLTFYFFMTSLSIPLQLERGVKIVIVISIVIDIFLKAYLTGWIKKISNGVNFAFHLVNI